jgi:hypothetical protein
MAPKIARIANLLIVHLQSIYIQSIQRCEHYIDQVKRRAWESFTLVGFWQRLLLRLWCGSPTLQWVVSLSLFLFIVLYLAFFFYSFFFFYMETRFQLIVIKGWANSSISLPESRHFLYCTTTGAAAADEPHKSLYLLAASFYVLMWSKSQAVGNVFVCLSRRLLGRRFHPFHFHKISK